MQHFAIIYKRTRSQAASLAVQLAAWLEARGHAAFCHENVDTSCIGCQSTAPSFHIPESVQAVIVLGGDGTFLSVARLLAGRTTPVVGINLGGLGFLTEVSIEACFQEMEEILAGHYDVEERMRLNIEVRRNGRQVFHHKVLNDAVINKGALARIIHVKTSIDGRFLTHYRGDGLIVATPTGSTAYNLSAGGPIVTPTAHCIILNPICPFTLTHRPIILDPSVTIQAEMGEPAEDVILTCDGQIGCELVASDRIIITANSNPLRLIKTPSTDYFAVLRTKLQWGQN